MRPRTIEPRGLAQTAASGPGPLDAKRSAAPMADLVVLLVTLAMFTAIAGFVRFCDRI